MAVQSPDAWQRMLEQTKKEVREIRSLEARVQWGMVRDEKKRKEGEKKENELAEMDWKHKDQRAMKEYLEEKAREQNQKELIESKEYQEFKRERKVRVQEEERRQIQESYKENTENSAWERSLTQVMQEEKKVELQAHVEKHSHLKELKVREKMREKQIIDEERQLAQAIEMDYRQRELLKEKEALLQSLDFARTCSGTQFRGGKSGGSKFCKLI